MDAPKAPTTGLFTRQVVFSSTSAMLPWTCFPPIHDNADMNKFVVHLFTSIDKNPGLVKNLLDVGKFFATKHHKMDQRSDPEKKNHICPNCYDAADQEEQEEVLSALVPLLANAYMASVRDCDDSNDSWEDNRPVPIHKRLEQPLSDPRSAVTNSHITKEQLDADLDEYMSHREGCECHKHFIPAAPITDQDSGNEDDDNEDQDDSFDEPSPEEADMIRRYCIVPPVSAGNDCDCRYDHHSESHDGKGRWTICKHNCACHKAKDEEACRIETVDAKNSEHSYRFEAYHCGPGRPDCGCRYTSYDFKWIVCKEDCPCHDPNVDCGFQNPHGASF